MLAKVKNSLCVAMWCSLKWPLVTNCLCVGEGYFFVESSFWSFLEHLLTQTEGDGQGEKQELLKHCAKHLKEGF